VGHLRAAERQRYSDRAFPRDLTTMTGLSDRTLRIAREVAATLFQPALGVAIPDERLQWMSSELRDYARCAGPRTSNGVSAIFLALQLLPLFVIGKFSRFTRLAPVDRTRYLEKIERSRILAPLLATTKIVLSLIYFEHPDVLREAGVTSTCLLPASGDGAWQGTAGIR
jgi:hypothetical protein